MPISFEKTITALAWLPEDIRLELDAEFSQIADAIAQDARSNHRFISRTGALEASITTEYTGGTVRAYLNESTAPYAKYVHDGQRSWEPDPFLEDAFTKHIKDIDFAIGVAVTKALALPGLVAGAVVAAVSQEGEYNG